MADEQANLGNEIREYRPRTCFKVGQYEPADQDDDAPVVLKRSYSAASKHVKFITTKDRDLLRCYRGDPKEFKPVTDPEHNWLHTWFHQEYVESWQTLSEFPVFIA
jgi:hypothetical protein